MECWNVGVVECWLHHSIIPTPIVRLPAAWSVLISEEEKLTKYIRKCLNALR